MISLWVKELRALFGVYVVCAVVFSADVVLRPLTERLDENPWTELSADLDGQGGVLAFVLMILALVTAYAAYPREHDERTIEFLYTLPVSRTRIFFVKAVSGAIVLCLAVIGGEITNYLLLVPSTQSFIGEQWRLDVALTAIMLRCVLAVAIYGHALLASFFRLFGLVPFFVLVVALWYLERISPSLAFLNPATLLDYSFDGSSLEVPWGLVTLHVVLGLASALLAALAWTGAGERVAFMLADAKTTVLGRVSLGCGTVAVVGMGLTGVIIMSVGSYDPSQPPPDQAEIEEVSFATAQASTEHFHFTYPVNLRRRAVGLVERSEGLRRRLLDLMDVEDDPARITVDLTEQSGHHLGITAWTKIRVGLVLHPTESALDRTFVHEVVHVMQNRLSDRRISDHGLSTGFFAEGSAELLALDAVQGGEDIRLGSRRIAVASWERHGIDQRELMNGEQLRERYDFRIQYALGEMWVAALVDRYGHGAVANVLRALGRPGASRDLGPTALWRDTLQAAGYSSEDVRARWEAMLAETAVEEREFIDAIPRLGGGVIRHDATGTHLLVTLDRDPPPGAEVLVAVRPGPDAPDETVRDLTATPRPDQPHRYEVVVPASFGAGTNFQYVPGIRPEGSHWVFFETWRTADR